VFDRERIEHEAATAMCPTGAERCPRDEAHTDMTISIVTSTPAELLKVAEISIRRNKSRHAIIQATPTSSTQTLDAS